MLVSKTIPIVFNGGAYGTYLEWVLTTLTTDVPIIAPFTHNGNSHLFKGRHLQDIKGWNSYVSSNQPSQFVRLHPKITKEESISCNLEQILSTVDRVLYIYPDRDSVLLTVNNYYHKVRSNWWADRLTDQQLADNLYSSWPLDPTTPIDKIPIWILREILSFNLMPSWYDQIEWYHPDKWSHPNCLIITVSDLLHRFDLTLENIKNFCNLSFLKDTKKLFEYHEQMLKLQKNLQQDQLCQKIVQSVVNDDQFVWKEEELPLPSQGWIQWQLRNLKFEMRCQDLDIFPTDSVQLKKLLYHSI
jgi:hypothetical protein